MTTVFLIRHAVHDRVDHILCGRMPGVRLGDAGRLQADRLAGRLAREALAAVYTSPLERARETAEALGPAEIAAAMTEIDFGDWTGCRFAALDGDPAWQRWNTERSTACAPGGETMQAVQQRAVGAIAALHARHPGARVAVVSHGDVIKSVVAAYLGLSLDSWPRFDIAPASVSAMALWGSGRPGEGKVIAMNETGFL